MTAYIVFRASSNGGPPSSAFLFEGAHAEYLPRGPMDQAGIKRRAKRMRPYPNDRDGWLDWLSAFDGGIGTRTFRVMEVKDLETARAAALMFISEHQHESREVLFDMDGALLGLEPEPEAPPRWDSNVLKARGVGSEFPPGFRLPRASDSREQADVLLQKIIEEVWPIDPAGPNGWLLASVLGASIPEGARVYGFPTVRDEPPAPQVWLTPPHPAVEQAPEDWGFGPDVDRTMALEVLERQLGPIDPDGVNGWILRALAGIAPPVGARVSFSAPKLGA